MARRVHAIVSGRVQGVSFRATTCREARRLGVVGWVRNLPDGTVELEAEGDDARIAELLAWCEHGPSSARVSRVAVDDLPVLGGDTEFVVN
ncbi:MAG TPA: acylphosphatase [Kofleriaceae bacterium]|jgi:acylphosphatase